VDGFHGSRPRFARLKTSRTGGFQPMDLEKLLKEATELRRQIEQLPQLIAQDGLTIQGGDIRFIVKLQTEIAAFSALQDHLAEIVRGGTTS
jgi:hypothetical protein